MSRTKRITALMLSALMIISLPKVSAENEGETKSFAEIGSDYSYNSYLESCSYSSAKEDIEINLNAFNQNSGAEVLNDYNGENTALKLSSGDSVTYNVTVPENGLYELELKYLCTKGRSLDAGLAVEIDNAAPYELAKEINLPHLWTNDGEKRTDGKGNEFAPPQKEADVFNTVSVYDLTGVENEPLLFALSAGAHSFKLTLTEEECVFSKIKLKAPTSYVKYEEKKSEYEKEGRKSADGLITIHAEDAVYKTKSSLAPKSNSNNSELYPSSVTNQLTEEQIYNEQINVYNENSFVDLGDFEVSWELVEDGNVIGNGTLTDAQLAARQTKTINISYRQYLPETKKPEAEYFLNVYVKLKTATAWANAGHELASEQFAIPINVDKTVRSYSTGASVNDTTNALNVSGNNFSFEIDKTTGAIKNYTYGGDVLLKEGPLPTYAGTLANSNDTFSIGCEQTGSRYSTAHIKNLRLFNNALTLEQVAVATPNDLNVEFWFDFDEFYYSTVSANGDVNGDGVTNLLDLVRIKKMSSRSILTTWRGDIDGDAVTATALDLSKLRKYLLSR